MNLALKHAIFAILLIYNFATLVAAAPLEDATIASNQGSCAATLRRIRPLAEQGDAAKQRSLGYLYQTGTCVPKNYAEAMKWNRKAADQGDANAQHNVGVMYLQGHGVRRDYFEAAKWHRKAAEQGNAYDQIILAAMYYKGIGVPRDYFEAAKWGLKGFAKTNFGKTIYIGVLVWAALSAAVALAAIARGRDGSLWFLLAWMISPLLAVIILMARPTGKSPVASRSSL